MKKSTISKQRSYITDLYSTNAVKSHRLSLLMLMLLTLLFVPTSMVAQTDYDTSVKFTALAGSPEGFANETYTNLFDNKKTEGDFSKWCCGFNGSAYVIFEATKAGVPVGYTITTGNDNANSGCGGRNPLSWKLYGNNEGKDGAWTPILEESKDTKLEDKNYASYDFTCICSTSYKYFKWEITAIHSGKVLQVGEFELKLKTCSHKDADGLPTLGEAIETKEATCIEHGYTTYKCSICNSTVKVYVDDKLKDHTLTHHVQKDATCTEAGEIEHWQCSVCKKLFSDADATTEITNAASLNIPANGHQNNSEGICTVCGVTDLRYALFNKLDGISINTITDKGSYPWQMLDLSATGMGDLGFNIPEGSKGLMSSNYHVDNATSKTVVNFTVTKPILLTFNYLVSSEKYDKATITLERITSDETSDKKTYETVLSQTISEKKQIEIKALLDVGKHSLTLSYNKDGSSNKSADRAFIYNLQTATTISDYVAEKDGTSTTLTFKYLNSDNLGSHNLKNIAIVNNERTVQDLCTSYNSIKNIVFEESFTSYAPTSLKNFFSNGYALEKISGLEYLNTANVTDMAYMFYGCSALKSLDLTKFNTANVTDMSYMFIGCSALKSLDLTKFNTARVTDMSDMFDGCQNLSLLNLSNFNTSNVTDMDYMFYNCFALTSLDLTNLNTANVKYMQSMFYNCKALTSLDLTNFNTENVKYMNNMFYGCSALTTIYASDNFKTTKVNENNGSSMFYGCKSLKGALPKYEETKTSSDYANYDFGYFTKLVGKNGDEKIGAVGETLTAESLALDDDKDFVAYEQFTAKAASYSREMNPGTTWATLCLPFEVTLDGKNFRAFKLLSANETTNTVELEEVTTSIAAGTPVIIKMNEGGTELSFSVADKEIAKEEKTSETENGNYQLQGIYTKKVFDKEADNNCYIVKGNMLMNPAKLLENTNTKTVGCKPFRAYMIDNTTAPAAGAKMFSIAIGDNSTTAIDNLNTIADDNATYYDLQGHRLNAPQKGINIVKRGSKTMKVIIK